MYVRLPGALGDPGAGAALHVSSVAQVAVPSPSQETITAVGVVALVCLIGLSAFFASSEIAIFSLGDPRVASLVEEGASGAATLAELKDNPRRLLVTILVGNNIANIAMSSISTGLLAIHLDSQAVAVAVSTFGITSIVLLFGESAPKSYAVENSESWALRIARPLKAAEYAMYPLIVVFDALTRVVNRAMGSEGNIESAYVTRADIREVIDTGGREGVLEAGEHRMLQRILRFRNRIVKEVMTPRLDVVAIPVEADLAEAAEACVDSGFTRLPVYDETLDDVVGIVSAHDLLDAYRRGSPSNAPSLASITRDAYVVPEGKDVDELLVELRAERRRMALVVDEFGATAGIVTIEDIVEEIVGEVLAETETVPIRRIDERTALVRGEVNVHAVNEVLGVDLPEGEEFETIAGLVFDRAGRLVEEGETVVHEGIELTVETAENNRVLEVRLEVLDGELAAEHADADADDAPDDPDRAADADGEP